jgi:lysyl-tRNA synthetase class 2
LDFDKIKEKEITLVGRILSLRSHGGSTFVNIFDGTSKFQLFFKKDTLGNDNYKFLKNFDIGDFIQVTGKLFKTKKEEKTLEVSSFKILTKSIKPLPDKWHGIKDEETRYRRRYLDILMNPELREMFQKKAMFWNSMRSFLIKKGFLEVETPVLEVATGGADANPFITHHNALDIDLYLRISMGELWQKRLMVAGFDKTFEIGRQFRNEGMDAEHLNDYSQMEFYWAYADYRQGMELVEELFKYVAQETFGMLKFKIRGFDIDLGKKWEEYDYRETVKEYTGIDIMKASMEEIERKLKELEINYDKKGFNITRAIDNLWKYCRKQIGGPGFLINEPIAISPLAKKIEGHPELTQRFHPIIAGSELGNGYSELNDPIDQAKRFEEQTKLREEGDTEAQMHDRDFVEALEYGMPPTCGFGVSERLFSFLMDKPIRECVLFPLLRPKNGNNVVKSTKSDVTFEISREKSFKLLKEHVKENPNIFHSLETEVIMKALAEKLGEDKELWGASGLLHDLDWEETGDSNPKEHGLKSEKYLKEKNYPEELIRAIKAHNFDYNDSEDPKTRLDYALRSGETITGLIYASALVRPDKKLELVEVKSIKKKMKDKSFAAKVNREVIKECEKLGLSLDEFIEISLGSMKKISGEIGL